jgi:hypothetical protein
MRKMAYPLALAITFAAGPALAQSPHFLSNRTSASLQNNGSLEVCWKEAGLGTNQLIDYVASADEATAVFVCRTNGNNCPAAANKIEFGDVTATGTFDSGKNGQITACLTIGVPAAGLTCPGGQTLVLGYVNYAGVSITDTTNGVTEDVPGTFTFRANFPPTSNCPLRIQEALDEP